MVSGNQENEAINYQVTICTNKYKQILKLIGKVIGLSLLCVHVPRARVRRRLCLFPCASGRDGIDAFFYASGHLPGCECVGACACSPVQAVGMGLTRSFTRQDISQGPDM